MGNLVCFASDDLSCVYGLQVVNVDHPCVATNSDYCKGIQRVRKYMSQSLLEAKVKLYSLLLDEDHNMLSDSEVDIMYLLSKDPAVKCILSARFAGLLGWDSTRKPK